MLIYEKSIAQRVRTSKGIPL